MKSFILISLITFVSSIQASPEAGDDQFPRCLPQTINISRATERCMDTYGGTPNDIFDHLRPIVLQYTDTDTDFSVLDEFLTINCQRMPKIIECLQRSLEPKSECPPLDEYRISKTEMQKLLLTGIESATKYVCANNGEVIKKLIPNEGAKFIFSNDDFSECTSNIASITHISELCPLINSVTECIKGIGGGHLNTYLKVVGQHFIDEWKTIGNC